MPANERSAQKAAARATLATIGREAAVSMSTVSKVLNGRPGVSEATRARVEDLLQRHGYSPRGDGTAAASNASTARRRAGTAGSRLRGSP